MLSAIKSEVLTVAKVNCEMKGTRKPCINVHKRIFPAEGLHSWPTTVRPAFLMSRHCLALVYFDSSKKENKNG